MSKYGRCSILTSSIVRLESETSTMEIMLFIYLHIVLFCEASCLLKYLLHNNQSRICNVIRFGTFAICANHIEAFGDSLWVVQQISKGYQCFDESLIVYLGVCLDAKFTLGCIIIVHIFRHDNPKELAQQASGYYVNHGVLHFSQ